MEVKDMRVPEAKVAFEDLPIGQVYEDAEGVICIKTSDDTIKDNCICFYEGVW